MILYIVFFPGGCQKVPRFSKSKNIQVASSKKHISNSKIIKNVIFPCSSLLKILFLPRNITCQRFFIILVQFVGNHILDVDKSTTRKSQQHIIDNSSMVYTEVKSGLSDAAVSIIQCKTFILYFDLSQVLTLQKRRIETKYFML